MLVVVGDGGEHEQVGGGTGLEASRVGEAQRVGVASRDELPDVRRRGNRGARRDGHGSHLGDLDHRPAHAGHGEVGPGRDVRAEGEPHAVRKGGVEVEEAGLQERVGGGAVHHDRVALGDQPPFVLAQVNGVSQQGPLGEQTVSVVDARVVGIAREELGDPRALGDRFGEVGLDDLAPRRPRAGPIEQPVGAAHGEPRVNAGGDSTAARPRQPRQGLLEQVVGGVAIHENLPDHRS